MTDETRLVQFLPPWRFGSGVQRYILQDDGQLTPHRPLRAEHALQKAARDIDGLVLRPSWPTRRGLALTRNGGSATLHAIDGQRLAADSAPIDINDPDFKMQVAERGLYRRFTFAAGENQLSFRDAAGRLVAPQRRPEHIFPEDDFSPFARLMGMLENPAQRERLLADLGKHRFKYSRWVAKPDVWGAPAKRALLS